MAGGPRNELFPVLNGFRAYAILGVVTLHLLGFSGDSLNNPLVWMATGGLLDVFFIVSGFGLFLPVVRSGGLGDLRLFGRKRFSRIFPTYWLALTIALIVVIATSGAVPPASEIAVQYAGLQMPVQFVDPGMPIAFGADQALWMISVILGVYLLLPLLAKPYLRHPLIGLAAAAAITVGWKLATPQIMEWVQSGHPGGPTGVTLRLLIVDQLPGWLYSFALGMTCAWAYTRATTTRSAAELRRIAVIAAPFAFAAVIACAWGYGAIASAHQGAAGGSYARSDAPFSLAYSTSRAAAMGVILLGPALLQRPFANALTGAFAKVSYGVYAIHFLIAQYVGYEWLGLPDGGGALDLLIWAAVVLPPSVAFGWIALRYFEEPARRWAGGGAGSSREPEAARALSAARRGAPTGRPQRA